MSHQGIEHLDSDFVAMKIAESEVPMDRGYDPNRFILQVKRDLLCFICHRVLKEPRVCEAGEHHFCFNCIKQHLDKESQKCPGCQEALTLETLQLPQRFLTNILSELRIRCYYNDHGCPKQVKLRDLEDHVNGCEYCPHFGAEAGRVVGRLSLQMQESGKEENSFRIQDFPKRAKEIELSKKRSKMRGIGNPIERNPEKIIDDLDKAGCEDLDNATKLGFQAETRDEVTDTKYDVMHREVMRMKEDFYEIRQTQEGITEEVKEIKDEVKEIKDEVKEIKEEVKEIKDNFEVLHWQFERFKGLLGHLLQENINRNSAQAMDPTIPANNQDVIILGGRYGIHGTPPLNTVEKYDIVEKRSIMLPPLNHPRAASASCVYNNDVLVVGGRDGKDGTATMEVLKMNQHPLRWTIFDYKLPVKLCAHDVIIYQGKLYIIGGYDWDEEKTSNAIYEIALTPPYTDKLLTIMPEARRHHRAELVNGKLFILGGSTTVCTKGVTDSVVVYDFVENELKPCPSLPQPVLGMSTVTWGTKIVVIGGSAKNDQILDDVIMYDSETGQSEKLPSMIHKRAGCSAVILHDVIVVFGGSNDEQGNLNSVETFTIGGDSWQELPGMIEKRWCATAVVKPHI